MEVIIYYRTQIESPIGEEIVVIEYIVKISWEVKYLGIILDNKLSFTAYIVRRTAVG